jgi:hypothetical protein
MKNTIPLVPDTIVLSCANGPREVKGWRVGKLWAVHSGSARGGGWTLTHVPSGCACGWFKTRKAAVALALDFIAKTPASFWSVKTNQGLNRKCSAMPDVRKTVHRLRKKHGQHPITPVNVPGVEYGRAR